VAPPADEEPPKAKAKKAKKEAAAKIIKLPTRPKVIPDLSLQGAPFLLGARE
jgi:hypothetical protein